MASRPFLPFVCDFHSGLLGIEAVGKQLVGFSVHIIIVLHLYPFMLALSAEKSHSNDVNLFR